MSTLQKLWNQFSAQLDRFWELNGEWRMGIALVVLVCGILAVEWLIITIRRRFGTEPEKRIIDITAFSVPLRLAAFGILMRIAESPLRVSAELAEILHAVEGLFIALAALVFLMQMISLLELFERRMPADLQEALLERGYRTFKNFLRIAAVVGVVSAYIYFRREMMPEWIIEYEWWRYALILGVVIIIYLFNRIAAAFLIRLSTQLGENRENMRLQLVLQSALWPVRLLLAVIVLYAAGEILQLPEAAANTAGLLAGATGTVAVFLFAYRLINVLEFELTRVAARDTNLLDQNFVHMVRFIARFIVVLIGAIYFIKAVSGQPLSALLAGLGIGGIAVALAAQDTLKNLLGSIMVMADKPFKVGQRIVVDGTDGVVEQIGFRSTRLRTLTGHLVTVPNEKMAANQIENIGMRPHIRRLTNITITYDTPVEKVKRAVEIIQQTLENHEGMHPDFPPRVFFNEFNDASLNILVIYWYHPNDYWGFCAFSEKVNLKIMEAFEAEGIEFAFPTTTTYLAHDDRRPLHVRFSEAEKDPGSAGPGV